MAVPVFTALIAPVRDVNDQSVYLTDSIAPTAGRVLLLVVAQKHASADQAAPTISGGGVSTWTQIASVNSTRRRLSVFRAETGTSPSSGAITITMAATMGSVAWSVIEVTDCLTTGTNAADAVVQSVTDVDASGTLCSLPLSGAWGTADALGFSAFYASSGSTGPYTATEAGFTSLGSSHGGSGDNAGGLAVFYGRNGSSQAVGASLASSDIHMGIGMEIAGAIDEVVPTIVYPRIRLTGLNGRIN